MHENAKLVFENVVKRGGYIRPGDHVLEIGPDQPDSTFRKMMNHPAHRWTTADIAREARADYVIADPLHMPLEWKDSFDVFFCSQVLEHVYQPWEQVKEWTRCVKPGGLLIFIVPISWPYHEAPVDCQRFYPRGMEGVFDWVGLKTDFCAMCQHESVGAGTQVPGRSLTHVTEPDLAQHYARNLTDGGPVECPVDLVAIARKPSLWKG